MHNKIIVSIKPCRRCVSELGWHEKEYFYIGDWIMIKERERWGGVGLVTRPRTRVGGGSQMGFQFPIVRQIPISCVPREFR